MKTTASVAALALLLTSCAARPTARANPAGVAAPGSGAAPAPAPLRDTHEGLQAVLWMQTAAEYQALAGAVYHAAKRSLDAALADPSWTAALEQEQAGNFAALPPAVVLDLDETVLDNSPFQAQLALDRKDYDRAPWRDWVAQARAEAVPGALDFLAYARSRQVAVIFITNREKNQEPAALANLRRLGLAATPDQVHCLDENGWAPDKTARRAHVARSHRILLLVGDDLGDFASVTGKNPAERVALARQHAGRWHDRWALLPNPLYGSWDRALYPGLSDDAQILQKKRRTLRGMKLPGSP